MRPKLGFVHFDPGEENSSHSAINLIDRIRFLPQLAQELDLDTVCISASELLEAKPSNRSSGSIISLWKSCVTS